MATSGLILLVSDMVALLLRFSDTSPS